MHLASGPLPGSLRFVVHSAAKQSGRGGDDALADSLTASDGVDRGIAFRNMHLVGEKVTARTKFHGAASLYNKGDSITLLRHEVVSGDGASRIARAIVSQSPSRGGTAAALPAPPLPPGAAVGGSSTAALLPEQRAAEKSAAPLRELFDSCGPALAAASQTYGRLLARGGFGSVETLLALHARSGDRAEHELVAIGVKWGHARELLQALLLFASQRGLCAVAGGDDAAGRGAIGRAARRGAAQRGGGALALPSLPRAAFERGGDDTAWDASARHGDAGDVVRFARTWQHHRERRAIAEEDRFLRCTIHDFKFNRPFGRGGTGQMFEVEIVPRPEHLTARGESRGGGRAGAALAASPFAEKMLGRKFALKRMWDFGSPSLTQHMATRFRRDFSAPREHAHQFVLRVHALFEAPTLYPETLEKTLGSGRTLYALTDLCHSALSAERAPRRGGREVSKRGEASAGGGSESEGRNGGAAKTAALDKRELTERQLLLYALQLSIAIEHLWLSGVVHRDVRVENILLFREGELRLVGFGCASSSLEARTWEGAAANMPPECLRAARRRATLLEEERKGTAATAAAAMSAARAVPLIEHTGECFKTTVTFHANAANNLTRSP